MLAGREFSTAGFCRLDEPIDHDSVSTAKGCSARGCRRGLVVSWRGRPARCVGFYRGTGSSKACTVHTFDCLLNGSCTAPPEFGSADAVSDGIGGDWPLVVGIDVHVEDPIVQAPLVVDDEDTGGVLV